MLLKQDHETCQMTRPEVSRVEKKREKPNQEDLTLFPDCASNPWHYHDGIVIDCQYDIHRHTLTMRFEDIEIHGKGYKFSGVTILSPRRDLERRWWWLWHETEVKDDQKIMKLELSFEEPEKGLPEEYVLVFTYSDYEELT